MIAAKPRKFRDPACDVLAMAFVEKVVVLEGVIAAMTDRLAWLEEFVALLDASDFEQREWRARQQRVPPGRYADSRRRAAA